MGSEPWDSSGPDTAGVPAVSALWNAFANMASLAGRAVTIVRGEGSYVYDDRGRPYLDALASLWYCNVGHGRAELADAAAAQLRQLAAYQTFEPFTNPPAEALARRVAALAPMPGAKVFLTRAAGRTPWIPRPNWPAATGAPWAGSPSRSRSPGRTRTTG
jgi:adenosylmethionine-8-amino-7-oxononanoate aminotransferase